MVKVYPKSANQPKEIALTICNSISRNCFRLTRDWKLESLANGKETSAVPFRIKKEEVVYNFRHGFSGKITVPFDLQSKFPDLFATW